MYVSQYTDFTVGYSIMDVVAINQLIDYEAIFVVVEF